MDQRLERHTRECSQEPMHAQAGTGAQTCDIFAVCGCSRKPIYRHMYTHTDTHILYIYYIIIYIYIYIYFTAGTMGVSDVRVLLTDMHAMPQILHPSSLNSHMEPRCT